MRFQELILILSMVAFCTVQANEADDIKKVVTFKCNAERGAAPAAGQTPKDDNFPRPIAYCSMIDPNLHKYKLVAANAVYDSANSKKLLGYNCIRSEMLNNRCCVEQPTKIKPDKHGKVEAIDVGVVDDECRVIKGI